MTDPRPTRASAVTAPAADTGPLVVVFVAGPGIDPPVGEPPASGAPDPPPPPDPWPPVAPAARPGRARVDVEKLFLDARGRDLYEAIFNPRDWFAPSAVYWL